MFELITGPMFSGKTEELLRRVRRAKIAGLNVLLITPTMNSRDTDYLKSRSGMEDVVVKLDLPEDIIQYVLIESVNHDKDVIVKIPDIVAIDEIQFFSDSFYIDYQGIKIYDVIKKLIHQNIRVIASGLDLTFNEEPFGTMGYLIAMADKVDKLNAICMECGSEYGCRTQRLINGEPAKGDSPIILIDDNTNIETYQARCLYCYKQPL